LHGGYEVAAGAFALQPDKLLRGDNDYFVAPVYRDMLRAFASGATYKFAEPSFSVLKSPTTDSR
jgi:hypothetical protein